MDIGLLGVLATMLVGFLGLGLQAASTSRKLSEDKGKFEEKSKANEDELKRHDRKCSKKYKQIFRRLENLEKGQAEMLGYLKGIKKKLAHQG